MNITFIGNCQTTSLCFYFQQLFECNAQWLLFGEEFKPHLGSWADKVKNKVLDYNAAIGVIKNSDAIVYQEIVKEKSLFSNTETLRAIKKESCRLIKIPSIHFNYSTYDSSMEELRKREAQNKVDIAVSDIIAKFIERRLMLTTVHPNTFLFLEIVDEICKILNIDTVSESKRSVLLQDNNYMKLP